MSMFKKIAHNSTLPALAGNNDLKLLQDVISSEKLVLQTLHKLSADFTRASEALRHWGLCEGEDLGDTLSACTTLFGHWSSSIASFSNHVGYIRECLKAVRTREEAFDEATKRRRALFSKADTAEKKLQKMNPENKNLRAQTDLLMGLKEQIRGMDVELMNEEAALADWKRTKSREWMSVLFGALSETSEKGLVVANYGRSIVANIPTESTEPGLPRAPYYGHSQVEPLVVEAERELHRIAFSADLGASPPPPPRNSGGPQNGRYQQEGAQPYPGMPFYHQSSDRSPVPLSPQESSYNEMGEFGSYPSDQRPYQTLGVEHNQPPRPDFEASHGSGFTPRGGQYSTMPNSRPPELHGSFNPAPERVAFSDEKQNPLTEHTDVSSKPRDRRFSQRLSTTLTAAMGTGWAMENGAPRLDSSVSQDEPNYSSKPPPMNDTQTTPALAADTSKSRERRLSNRLSSALGVGWSLDGGAPRLDPSVQEPPPEPTLERTSSPPNPSRTSSPMSQSKTPELPESSVTNRISKRLSSALGTGWSMDGGAPQLSSSSLPVSPEVEEEEQSSVTTFLSKLSPDITSPVTAQPHKERRPSTHGYSPLPEEPISERSQDSTTLSPDTLEPRPRRLSQRLSASLTSAMGGGWAMENGAPRLDSTVSGLTEPSIPAGPRSRSPSVAAATQNQGLAPDTSSKKERRLSQRLSATLSSAMGGGWSMENGAPRLDGSAGYQEPPPSYVPHAPPPGAAPPIVPGGRPTDGDFDPYKSGLGASSSQGHSDESPYLAYLDESAGRKSQEDRRVYFGGSEDERNLNAQAAREIGQQMDRNLSPLVPPKQPFASSRSVSPRPTVVTDSPIASYARGEQKISPSSNAPQNVLSPPIPRSTSPSSFASAGDTPYQTPPEYFGRNPMSRATSPPASSPMTPTNKTISAAAFRRPNMRPAGSSSVNLSEDGGPGMVADVTPLNFRKRSLPNVNAALQAQNQAGMPRIPSAPGPRPPVPRDSHALEDDFDYISAYIDGDSSGTSPPNNSGYGSGNFTTNLDGGQSNYR